MTVWIIVALLIGFGGGWYCKSRFGKKVSAVKNAVSDVV